MEKVYWENAIKYQNKQKDHQSFRETTKIELP